MTGCLAVRKDVFQKIGVFHEGYKRAGGEEWEFGFRAVKAGIPIYSYNNVAVFHHFGSLRSTIRDKYFRTINFAMLMFANREQGEISFADIDMSVPRRDRNTLIYVTLILVSALGLLLNILFWQSIITFIVLSIMVLFFVAIYCINVRGLYAYSKQREGWLFTVCGFGIDFLVTVQTIFATVSALLLFFLLQKKEFKI